MTLLVGVILDIDEVVSHGLVGQLMQEWTDRVKTSLQYQQLCLRLSLETESYKLNLWVELLCFRKRWEFCIFVCCPLLVCIKEITKKLSCSYLLLEAVSFLKLSDLTFFVPLSSSS